MPSDDILLEQATQYKVQGNDAFGAGHTSEAVASYSLGVAACDRMVILSTSDHAVVILKATLLANRGMCQLKVLHLNPAIEDCTAALDLLTQQNSNSSSSSGATSEEASKLRAKLLFRRAKARFLLHSMPNNNSNSDNKLLPDAAKDLLMLLNDDPKNTDAQQLLTTIRSKHKVTQTATTPVSKTLQALQNAINAMDEKDQLQQVKILLGLLDNDLVGTVQEMGRLKGPELLLTTVESALASLSSTKNTKLPVLAMQCISTACSHPAFVREYVISMQSDLLRILTTTTSSSNNTLSPDLIVSTLATLTRIILHADRDLPQEDISIDSCLDDNLIVECLIASLTRSTINTTDTTTTTSSPASSIPITTTVLRAVLDVLSTWTAGTDRDAAIRTALCGRTDPTLPIPVGKRDLDQMTPQQLATYKKRQVAQRQRDETWATQRTMLFLRKQTPESMYSSGLQILLQTATNQPDHVIRREVAVAVGRLLTKLIDHDQLKSMIQPFLQSSKEMEEEAKIVEISVHEEEKNEGETMAVPLETKMQRALITSALLLSSKELGAWALAWGWRDSGTELPDLIESDHPPAMCLAAEVLSAAATVEGSRQLVIGMTTSGAMEKLMKSTDRDIRSGAASAVAKLGLSEKQSDEGEIMGLLVAACELLEDNENNQNASTVLEQSKKEIKHFSSVATSTVERSVEMISYLVSHTTVKEELAAGFSSRLEATYSALDRLVQTADLPSMGESLSGFGLATIFQNMAATNEQIRREAFEGKEVTMEQYDEMQRMGKTEEEKDLMDQNKDPDTKEMCGERIRKMANANVPRALVALTEGASEHTLEQLALAMNRMADEIAIRGIMIQQGALSACIKLETNEGPTQTDVMKKVIRLARHCIAKMLISTNPTLLTSAQRLGSIRPLINLIRDIKASELQHFEALLAVTNLAGSGEDAKNRIVSERGIATFHFAMFSDHNMVRTAATEAMCNLVPHKAMMEHLANNEHLRLWFAFAVDFEDNYECSRAATGCLAMASQDLNIAEEIVKLDKFQSQMSALLECGRLELMHRTLVVVLNLILHGSVTREKTVAAGLVEFCRAYVALQHHQKKEDELEFSPEDLQILPITVDIAKKIVLSADE